MTPTTPTIGTAPSSPSATRAAVARAGTGGKAEEEDQTGFVAAIPDASAAQARSNGDRPPMEDFPADRRRGRDARPDLSTPTSRTVRSPAPDQFTAPNTRHGNGEVRGRTPIRSVIIHGAEVYERSIRAITRSLPSDLIGQNLDLSL
ncbi:hypothetical protein [Rhodospira trueperi]|uniref:Uncharacterized protein n=1 Tax=Rhodospira trueperi TaxID=69960 RepID=A0A1G7BQD5_9PROT|nr:hypothetical protein [Rhodospira trueperi]SDE29187.1 hypothetical protein SAMN05421720_105129 [Rhodospira trueperi]